MSKSTIGSVCIDVCNEQVFDESGRKLDLRPRTFTVFLYLCNNRGRVVTKSELLEKLWDGLVVTEDSVIKCISEIRKELNGSSNIDLKTIAKKGYQLTESPIYSPEKIETPTLVVMPFQALNHEAKVCAAGLSEDVTTLLCQNKDIFVVAQHSANYASRELGNSTPGEISDSLGVRYILQGTVQESNSTLRVNAYLTDVVSSARVWSEKYEETHDNLLKVQDTIGVKIVNRICGSAGIVGSTERSQLRRAIPTNPAAYELYVMGSNVDKALTKSGSHEAIKIYQKVVELDPSFARAWMRLAAVYLYSAACAYTEDLESTIKACVECALKAEELDANDSLVQGMAGGAYCFLGEFAIAKERFARALALGPNDADTLVLVAYVRLTKFDTVEIDLENIRRAISLNPFHPKWYSLAHGYAAYHSKNYAEAITALRNVDSDFLDKDLYLTLCYAETNSHAEMENYKSVLLKMRPDITASLIIAGDSMQDSGIIEHFKLSCSKAGLPL